jgi:hypothetical protein
MGVCQNRRVLAVIPTEPAEGRRPRDLATRPWTYEDRSRIPPRDLAVAVGMTTRAADLVPPIRAEPRKGDRNASSSDPSRSITNANRLAATKHTLLAVDPDWHFDPALLPGRQHNLALIDLNPHDLATQNQAKPQPLPL